MRALRSPLCLLVLLCAALLGAAFETADSVVDPDVKPPSFNKAELEELLKKEREECKALKAAAEESQATIAAQAEQLAEKEAALAAAAAENEEVLRQVRSATRTRLSSPG